MSRFTRSVLLVLVVSLASLYGQDITKGSIAGVVRDTSGAVVVGARVLLTSPYGERTTSTNAAGEYVFPNLVVGSGYSVTVEQSGFSSAKLPNLSVGVNQRITADVTLQVGATATTATSRCIGTFRLAAIFPP